MGFCLLNNVAVAAAHALAAGVARVAIVDVDVHHGNGTQAMFYEEPRVLYLSTHQHPHYPGTGAAGEVGRGAGEGFTVNVPLEAGATDGDYEIVCGDVIVPILERFAPELILVSAGFDAHEQDPLGCMRLSAGGYAFLVRRLGEVAARFCQDRLVLVTEGGYELRTLQECLDATIGAACDSSPVHRVVEDTGAPTGRSAAVVDLVRAAQRRYWQI